MRKNVFIIVMLIALFELSAIEKIAAQANTSLSNLVAPTAVNVDLIPFSTNLRSFGSSGHNWNNMFFIGNVYKGSKLFIGNRGTANTFLGILAGRVINSGKYNTAIGHNALYSDTSGYYNTAIGAYALDSNTEAYYNTAVGAYALFNTRQNGNTGVGYTVLYTNTSGSNNTGMGLQALYANTSGYGNTAIGSGAMIKNLDGGNNTAIGTSSLYFNTSGYGNTALGYASGQTNTTGFYNTAIGYQANYGSSTSSYNTALGAYSLNSNTASYNTAVGTYALYNNNTGYYNVALGYQALNSNTIGYGNSSQGYQSLLQNTTGFYNTANGFSALLNNTVGAYNAAYGLNALYNNASGQFNVGYGGYTLFYDISSSSNTAIGWSSGMNIAGNGTFLGSQSGSAVGLVNVTAVGYGATATANNQVRVGNTSVTSIGGQVGWTTFSDGRFKKNIKEDVPGLDFINQLRPITYTVDAIQINKILKDMVPLPDGMDRASVTSKEEISSLQAQSKEIKTGFIAQEVEKAAKNLSYNFDGVDIPKNEKDFYGIRYSEFVVPLVKAVQELSKKNEDLEKEIKELRSMILNKGGNINTSAGINLEQNQPNPYSGSTTIHYSIPAGFSSAHLVVTDYSGKKVKDYTITEGSGTINIDAARWSSGAYNYSIVVDGKISETKKMVIAR
ncbi:MAG: tail fiber domain-containing protein [Flavisolibacter sp.]